MTEHSAKAGSMEVAGTATQIVEAPDPSPTRRLNELADRASLIRTKSTVVQEDATKTHQAVRSHKLDYRTTLTAKAKAPQDLLAELSRAWGLSWALIARLVGVSPTAVRKWRRGDSVAPKNRRALARLVTLLEIAREDGLPLVEPASWLEMPLSDQSTLTPASLYEAGREDLILDLICGHTESQEVLDAFDPDWRTRHAADSRFEVTRSADGMPVIAERG